MGDSIFLQDIALDAKYGVTLKMFRLDLLHPIIQGNKYFKLLYNLEYAHSENKSIITMGGPHSNHIYAAALACESENISSYGIIRGNNFNYLSHTLQRSQDLGMKLIFADREDFRAIRDAGTIEGFKDIFTQNNLEFPENYHFIPEGGTNALGIKGAGEILENIPDDYDYIFCPVGTGGTLSGLINYLQGAKIIAGISALKDDYLEAQVKEYTHNQYSNWQINFNYHFGGFAKWNMELIEFINEFKRTNKIPLCPLYTGKMMYAIQDLLEKNYFPEGSTVLALHTGGIQGIEGFNQANNDLLI